MHDSGLPFDEQAELQSLFVRVNAKRVGLKLPNDRFPFKMSHDIKLVNILKWCCAMGKQIGGPLSYGRVFFECCNIYCNCRDAWIEFLVRTVPM